MMKLGDATETLCQYLPAVLAVFMIHKRRETRVVTVREKYLENEIFSRSGKSQGILWVAREI